MMINHVVLFKWKPGTSQATIDSIYRELEGLKRLIPGLHSFSGGPYSSHEGLNQGYTHGFIMTFTDAPARNAYLPHPEHERVKAMVAPNLENVIAFDWES
jgi:Stress responsive A/B Barrel Domain